MPYDQRHRKKLIQSKNIYLNILPFFRKFKYFAIFGKFLNILSNFEKIFKFFDQFRENFQIFLTIVRKFYFFWTHFREDFKDFSTFLQGLHFIDHPFLKNWLLYVSLSAPDSVKICYNKRSYKTTSTYIKWILFRASEAD